MHDPLPVPESLYRASTSLAESLHLRTLPFHVHEVAIGFTIFSLFNTYVSPVISTYLLGHTYRTFPKRTKISWNVHATSTLHAIIISAAAIWVILCDDGRQGAYWEGRIWDYSGASGMVQGFTTGYFLWDLKTCTLNFAEFGPLDLLHALCAAPVTFLGFRPFALYHGIGYLLFELSTPFANIHWALNKTGLAGSRAQIYNGIALMATFFCCRVIWGSYCTWRFYGDIWNAYKAPIPWLTVVNATEKGVLGKALVLSNELPTWLAVVFVCSNTALMSLNFFWFAKMVETMSTHMRNSRGKGKKANGGVKKEGKNGFVTTGDGAVGGDARRRSPRKNGKR